MACSFPVLAFRFFPGHAGVATLLLHGEDLGYGGNCCSLVLDFSQNDTNAVDAVYFMASY